MKNLLILTYCAAVSLVSFAHAGTETYSSKSSKETAAQQPCPTWYADREWNVILWGTYAFTGGRYTSDHYLETDHAWGGGIDTKYFFHRYFGIGVEGWAVAANRAFETVTILPPPPGFVGSIVRMGTEHDERAIGSVVGTFTLRYPLPRSRFSPYVWAGGGTIFGGEEREKIRVNDIPAGAFLSTFRRGSRTEAIGQFGAGLEIRLLPHIGLINDFNWNVVDGSNNNFGMARTGINFAF